MFWSKTVTFPNNRNESNKNVLHLRHFPTELFNYYTVTHRSTIVFTKHCSYKVLKSSSATNNVNNGKFPSLLCRNYSIEPHYVVSFLLLFPSKGTKGRQIHEKPKERLCWRLWSESSRSIQLFAFKNVNHFILQN